MIWCGNTEPSNCWLIETLPRNPPSGQKRQRLRDAFHVLFFSMLLDDFEHGLGVLRLLQGLAKVRPMKQFRDIGKRVKMFLKLSLRNQKSITRFTGWLSRASKLTPFRERPSEPTTSLIKSVEACGIPMPNPIPVLMDDSRFLTTAEMASWSWGLILPVATRLLMSSSMACQRSAACNSVMICSFVRMSPKSIASENSNVGHFA